MSTKPAAAQIDLPKIPDVFSRRQLVDRLTGNPVRVPVLTGLRAHIVMMLTGLRRSEALTATAVIGRGGEPSVRINDFRTARSGRERVMAMTGSVREILVREREYRKRVGVESPLLFANSEGDRLSDAYMSELQRALLAGFKDWSGMKAVSAGYTELGPSIRAMQRSLGHRPGDMSKFYLARSRDLTPADIEKLAETLSSQTGVHIKRPDGAR